MPITYPIAQPTTLKQSRVEWHAMVKVAQTTSEFTGEQRRQDHLAEWWEADVFVVPQTRADAEDLIADLLSLRGKLGTMLYGDPAGRTSRGSPSGSPQVFGASQAGNQLITSTWPNSTLVLKKGDWISVGSSSTQRLYKNLTDATTDGSGNVTLDIFPRLHESPADASAITYIDARGAFKLVVNDTPWEADAALIYGINFGLREDF